MTCYSKVNTSIMVGMSHVKIKNKYFISMKMSENVKLFENYSKPSSHKLAQNFIHKSKACQNLYFISHTENIKLPCTPNTF
jgi:hypothetical protein